MDFFAISCIFLHFITCISPGTAYIIDRFENQQVYNMAEVYNLRIILNDRVQKLLDNFASVMGGHIVFYDRNGEVLTTGKGEGNSPFCLLMQERYFSREQCQTLDNTMERECAATGKCVCYTCHAFLREALLPVRTPDAGLLGFVMFGQFRSEENLPPALKNMAENELERQELERLYRSIPLMSDDTMENLTGLLETLVEYIAESELVSLYSDPLLQEIRNFIDTNYMRNVTLSDAARTLRRSVSTLSHYLQKHVGTSFKKMLIEKRLTTAEDIMQKHPEWSIGEVASASGFEDRYYFSRIYRKYRGITAGEFRKKK